ncbi:MAG: hypothetical protein RBS48_04930 [Ignavibacteriaceae bacterium]|nr:hypothetical protein [Ignavibacteriaceae bacterium]
MDPQSEIKKIMASNNITYQDIADGLHTYYQKIYYAIEKSKDLSLDLYTEIMSWFERRGYVGSSADRCSTLVQHAFKMNAEVNENLKKLNSEMVNDIADNKFAADERIRMRYRLEDMKKDFNNAIDALLKITEA